MARSSILMIHGMWARANQFAALQSELSAHGIDSTAPDLPLHEIPPGAPAPEGIGTLKLSDYVTAAEQALHQMGPDTIVLGHSMGGLIAQHLAARNSVRGLILLSTAASSSAVSMSFDQMRIFGPLMMNWGWWREPTQVPPNTAQFAFFNNVPDEEARAAINQLTWDSGAVLSQIGLPYLDSTHESRVNYAAIRAPALVITGTADRAIPAATSRQTARLLAPHSPRVDYEEWPGVPHWLFHDAIRPRLVARIGGFLGSLE